MIIVFTRGKNKAGDTLERPAILIVEDEQKLARILQLELEFENYETEAVDNGNTALQVIQERQWDLILLDIMLPGFSGLEVLRRLRKTDATTPVILLTARDQVHDKVRGLDLGANDYVTKPFDIEELLARIRVHLRQNKRLQVEYETEKLSIADLTVDIQGREVICGKEQIELTAREFDLLVYLLKNKNIVLTREQIIEAVWGYDYYGDTNIVDVYIRYVRQKIDKNTGQSIIQTVRGVGYTIKE